MHLLKTIDASTGELVAWSRWGYPFTLTEEEKKRRDAEKAAEEERERADGEKSNKWPKGANRDACEAFFGSLDAMRERYVKWDEDYS